MFGKLLKHDLKSLSRVGKPLAIGTLILGLLGCLASVGHSLLIKHSYKLLDLSSEAFENGDIALSDKYSMLYTASSFATSILAITMFLGFLLLCASILTMMVLIVVNFYKTLITDEGYLTFTLPVSPTKILLSKVLNGIIWNTIMLVIFGLGLALIIVPSIKINDTGMLYYLFQFDGLDKMNLVLFVILMIESTYFSLIAYQIFYFFAVFLGGIVASKRKILASAGIIVGGHVIYYVFQQIVSFILMAFMFVVMSNGTDDPWLSSNPVDTFIITNVSLLFSFICSIVIGVVFLHLTNWLMNKKLNLP